MSKKANVLKLEPKAKKNKVLISVKLSPEIFEALEATVKKNSSYSRTDIIEAALKKFLKL